jgi:hypothetical protein
LARDGGSLSYDEQITGWSAYIDAGDYSDDQRTTLVAALMNAQREEFNALLPEGCVWFPRTSEVIGPVDTDLAAALADLQAGQGDDTLDDAMEMACERVIARFDLIEREALGQ